MTEAFARDCQVNVRMDTRRSSGVRVVERLAHELDGIHQHRPSAEQSLDGPTRANQFADSRKSPDSRESLQGSQIEPLLLQIPLRGG